MDANDPIHPNDPSKLSEAMARVDKAFDKTPAKPTLEQRRDVIAARPSNRLTSYQAQVARMIDTAREQLIQLQAEYDHIRVEEEMQMGLQIDKVTDEAAKLEERAAELRARADAMTKAMKEHAAERAKEFQSEKKAQERIIKAHKAMQSALGVEEHDDTK